MPVPNQKPGKSEQSVQTPTEFLYAVKTLLGIDIFAIDLAADVLNSAGYSFYDEAADALQQPWAKDGLGEWLWCNPPYKKLEPWVEKAALEASKGAKIAMLVPSSTGSNWWKAWVAGVAQVHFLNGRIKFVGHKNYYPKDLALLLYRPDVWGGFSTWHWQLPKK